MDTLSEMWPSCQHPEFVLCKRIIANGALQYWRQCVECGTGTAVARNRLTPSELDTPHTWDDTLSTRYYAEASRRRTEAWNRKQQERIEQENQTSREWWTAYNRYLQSPQWKERRQRVLERDNYLCQGCLTRRATQVHHLTYERVGNEMMFDLISICTPCHDALHEDKSQRRAA